MKRQYIIFSVIMIFLQCTVYAAEPVFERIIREYLSVRTIKGRITQHIYPGDGTVEVFSGDYYASSGGLVRIDYSIPEKQTVIVNSRGLYWYYPDRRLLFRAERNSHSGSRIPALTDILPAGNLKSVDIQSEGNRFYSFFKTASVYSIISGTDGTRLVLWVDTAAGRVVRKYMIDKTGREMVREEYVEHQIINGITLPVKIDFRARSVNGIIHTFTEYSNVVINSEINGAMFRFKVTPDMEVREIGQRGE